MASDNGGNPALFCSLGSETTSLSDDQLREQVSTFLDSFGEREDVLLLPPDYTRFHSQAGKLTQMICEHYGFISSSKPSPEKRVKLDKSSRVPKVEILPALGTHAPMTAAEIAKMFGEELAKKEPSPFLVHDWRNDVVTIGEAPAEMVKAATHGMVDKPWPAQLNKVVWSKREHDPARQANKSLVISIGQVVPHEVMGMANYNKNIFVGTGGTEAINLSHFIGAVHGMESIMGKADNPLRQILQYASEKFLEQELDVRPVCRCCGASTLS